MEFKKVFNNILIIDGSYMIHRSLHVTELFNLKNSKGMKTGGIFGFLRSFFTEVKHCYNYYPVVTWDSGLSPRRVSIDPYYKHADERNTDNTVLTIEELDNDYVTQYRRQRNMLIKLLSYFGVPSLKFKNWEGDDLMYILTKISSNSLVLTDDRDLLQLLSDTCRVRRPMANEDWSLESFLNAKGYSSVRDFITCKAIIGDNSDNIPKSCKGVGDKSINNFIKLLKESPNMSFTEESNLKDFCKSHDIKYSKSYLNFDKKRFDINMQLVDLSLVESDVDDRILDSIITTIKNCRQDIDYFKVIKLFHELEIKEFPVDNLMELLTSRYKIIGE